MNFFHETIIVPEAEAHKIELLCRGPANGCGPGEVVFDREIMFEDGCRMAIQAIAPDEAERESCWTQGVLFSSEGDELGFTESGGRLRGVYRVKTQDGTYSVSVHGDSESELLAAAANLLDSLACEGDEGGELQQHAADLAWRVRAIAAGRRTA